MIELAALAAALVVGLYIRAYHYQSGYVPSQSMSPTLQPGDRYLLKKSAYHRRIPRRGDVIVFRDPRDSSLLIKRVVALPGEDVFVFQGQLYKYVNGRWIAQEYAEASPLLEMPQRLTVPDDAVYVLGDNRAMSEDSRDFGPVPLDRIIGQAVYIIWPLDRVGPIR